MSDGRSTRTNEPTGTTVAFPPASSPARPPSPGSDGCAKSGRDAAGKQSVVLGALLTWTLLLSCSSDDTDEVIKSLETSCFSETQA